MIGADASIKGPIVLNEGIIIYGTVIGDIESKGPVRVCLLYTSDAADDP